MVFISRFSRNSWNLRYDGEYRYGNVQQPFQPHFDHLSFPPGPAPPPTSRTPISDHASSGVPSSPRSSGGCSHDDAPPCGRRGSSSRAWNRWNTPPPPPSSVSVLHESVGHVNPHAWPHLLAEYELHSPLCYNPASASYLRPEL